MALSQNSLVTTGKKIAMAAKISCALLRNTNCSLNIFILQRIYELGNFGEKQNSVLAFCRCSSHISLCFS